jgi:hypothetical protein
MSAVCPEPYSHMSMNLEEAFSLPSLERAVSAPFSIIDLSCTDSAVSRIGAGCKKRTNTCKSLAVSGRSSFLDRRAPADDSAPSLIFENRIHRTTSRAQSACTEDKRKNGKSCCSTRATYNFHMGLLTHRESNQTYLHSCGASGRVSASCSSSKANDELWDFLLH